MLNGNQTELARKEANLIDGIEKTLPDFARACRAHDNTVVTMNCDRRMIPLRLFTHASLQCAS
jgi:hypothetical protein